MGRQVTTFDCRVEWSEEDECYKDSVWENSPAQSGKNMTATDESPALATSPVIGKSGLGLSQRAPNGA